MPDITVIRPEVQTSDGRTLKELWHDNGDGTFSPVPYGTGGTGASSPQTQGTAASGTTSVGNPVKMGLVYNLTQPTVASGQVVDAQADMRGNQMMNMASRIDPVNDTITTRPFSFSPTYINAIGTVNVPGARHLAKIIITGGTLGAFIVYNNTAGSGTILAEFDGATMPLGTYEFNVAATVGVTIVTTTAIKLTLVTGG